MHNKILIIDDDQEIRVMLQKILSTAGYSVYEAEDGETGLQLVALEQPDLILLDINMPNLNGIEICRKLRSDPKNNFAIIMLTAVEDKEVEGLESGADDYIVKPFQKKVLLARIKSGLAVAERRKDAFLDPLTNVFNRRTFNNFLLQEEERALRYGRPLSVIITDIDNFKVVNDAYGHDAGDDVLIEVAAILRQNCRRSDLLARIGGEEFVILLPETNAEDAVACAEKARRRIEEHTFQHVDKVTASFGIAEARKNDPEGLLKRADTAMYESKKNGRNRVSVDVPLAVKERPVSLLVIDDDEAIRDLIRIKMVYRGYDVHVAENGDAAFRILQEHEIDLVLIDQEMPGRDGMSTYLAIKNEWPKLPTIMITAHGSRHLIKSFLVSGGRDFIEKPIVDFESFDFRIRRVLAELRKEQEAEEKLREAKIREESRKAKDLFLESMSHELRTPLSHILKFARQLHESLSGESRSNLVLLERIEGAATSLNRIIEDILEMTIVESNVQCTLERVVLSDVLRKVKANIDDRGNTKGKSLTMTLPEYLPPVKADQQKLVEVVDKLICNSMKYADGEGVSVTARAVPDEIIVAVFDRGSLIPQERIPYLFEPFGKSYKDADKRPGTDLALYKSRRLIELMGGRIWVNSEKGKGTTFFFSLNQDIEQ